MRSLAGKTLFISGASRGIGKAIALRAAKDGANIVIAAKTVEPHPKLDGTIYTAAEEISKAGGKPLPVVVDTRNVEQIEKAVQEAVDHFGGIDILINNASAISLTGTLATDPKKFDLMHDINLRGTFFTSRACIPHLLKSKNPHVLSLCPPIQNVHPKWYSQHCAYTIAKFGMSMCIMGMAEEFRKDGIAFNGLWPKTTIATAAIKNILGGNEMMERSRTPDIISQAAWYILTRDSRKTTGQFFIDEKVLEEEGETDLDKYCVNIKYKNNLQLDLFLE